MDPLLPGIPVDAFSSWAFFLASVRMKIIHLCPSAMKASSLRSGEKGILSSSHDARFNLPQVNALTADLPAATFPKGMLYFRI